MSEPSVEFAPAKVNLYLRVTGRRPDGYHLLDSLAVFPDVGDVLSFEPSDMLSLEVVGPFGAGLAEEGDNLVLRAARLLAERAGVKPVGQLRLDKQLPVASGIGGGSADAAAALRLLCRMWDVALPDHAMLEVAGKLGADVPVCLQPAPARMGGIGEVLLPAPRLPDCGMVLVNPGVGVSTPEVFRARAGGFSEAALLPQGWPDVAAMAIQLTTLGNDLEAPAIRCAPVIASVLAVLRSLQGCLVAGMSGSGATCFALFPSAAEASSAASRIESPGWWRWGGALR